LSTNNDQSGSKFDETGLTQVEGGYRLSKEALLERVNFCLHVNSFPALIEQPSAEYLLDILNEGDETFLVVQDEGVKQKVPVNDVIVTQA
tara:strand:- start:21845 stop:22114 length:270 start_codon:yes stop_codon:yes gene_type:complete